MNTLVVAVVKDVSVWTCQWRTTSDAALSYCLQVLRFRFTYLLT